MFLPQPPTTSLMVSYPYSVLLHQYAEYSIHFSRADIFGQRKTSVNYEEENNDDGDDDDDDDGDGDGDDDDKMRWNRLYLGLGCIRMRWNKIK